MNAAYRLARIEADGRRLLALAGRGLDASVPACPGWDLADLVEHVARNWTWVAAQVSSRADALIPASELPDVAVGAAVTSFAEDALGQLLNSFDGVDPATHVWSWSSQHDVAFYQRRMHQETLIHRVDAEQAAADPSPVESDDGADGVDELFTVILEGRSGDDLPQGSLHLHRTDGEGEWLLGVVDGTLDVRREHAKGDAALRATGDELLLAMWGRRSFDGLELFGDVAVAEAWAGLTP